VGPASFALISALGLVSAYCFALVGRACAATGATTYRGAWEKSVDEKSGAAITAVTTAKTLVGAISCCIIIGDTAGTLLGGAAVPALLKRRDAFLSIFGALFLYPLAMLRDMKSLAPASIVGLGGMLYAMGVLMLRCFDGTYAPGGRFHAALMAEGGKLPTFAAAGTAASTGGALLLVSILATGYLAHYNAASYYAELEDPTIRRYNRVVYGGFAMAIAFNIAFAAAGHRTFGGAAAGLILNSFAKADGLANAARGLVGLAVACTYPLLFKGIRDGVFDLAGTAPATQETVRTPITIALVALTVYAGITIRDLGLLTAIAGAGLGSALIYILPTQIALSAAKKGKLALGRTEKVICRGINLAGYVIAALGGTACVLSRLGKI
jgi:sodium-coupled neutral amino acid transporter 11